jgi:hypothetical protein
MTTGRMSGPTGYEMVCHPLYLAVAGGLNLPPMVFGIMGYTSWCSYFSSWLVGNACLTGMNMVAAFYSVYKIRRIAQPPPPLDESAKPPDLEKPEDDAESSIETIEEQEDDSAQRLPPLDLPATQSDIEMLKEDTESKMFTVEDFISDDSEVPEGTRGCFSRLVHLRTISSERIRHLLCYDGLITTYSILFLFWVFWISDGTQRKNDVDLATEDELEGCMEYHERYVQTSLVFGFSYFTFVCFAVISSLCWR